MNTSSDTPPSTRSPGIAASVLLGLLAATWAAGCGEPLPAEDSHLREARSAIDPCPTGVCTGNGNGPGIFISEGASYCIPGLVTPLRFCPESFTHHTDERQDTSVWLRGRRVPASSDPQQPEYVTLKAQGMFHDEGAEVLGFQLHPSRGLVITIRKDGSAFGVMGTELHYLTLDFTSAEFRFSLRFRPNGSPTGFPMYEVDYAAGQSPWQSHCGTSGAAAFLPGYRIHSTSAQIETPSSSEVTMACESGAIVTCMHWGYRPHEATGEGEEQARAMFGACMQAKRAAYFVESGDYNSYTSEGASIFRHDLKGYQADLMPGVEALWGPDGAVCFNPGLRRIKGADSSSLPELPASYSLPPCDALLNTAAQQGTLHQFLTQTAPLATGPVPY